MLCLKLNALDGMILTDGSGAVIADIGVAEVRGRRVELRIDADRKIKISRKAFREEPRGIRIS